MAETSDIWQAIQRLDRLVFTTLEIAALTNSSLSLASQQLGRVERKGVIRKVRRGLWAISADKRFSPLLVVPFLGQQSYVSFITALHLYGMISQIPQMITVATTMHGRQIKTPVGTFVMHRIVPDFFIGFDWAENGRFLIASKEKALVDCLYISTRRGKRYQFFPELIFPNDFDKSEARRLVKKIGDEKLRKMVLEKLEQLL